MATKNNPGAFDCYAKAEPDEPMFVLLARDKHAPTLIWLWATLRELDEENPEVVREARECAVAMLSYAHEHGRKSVGFGQAALAGVMELIRTVNDAIRIHGEKSLAAATDVEVMRQFLAGTRFEGVKEKDD